MERVDPVLRVATPHDAPRVEALMKESAAAIFPGTTTSGSQRARSATSPRSTRCCSPTAPTTCSRWTASSSPAAAGAGATGSTPAVASPRATAGCSTRHGAGARTGDVRPRRLDTTRPGPAHHRGVRDRGPPRGFRRLALLATLPGVPLYRACGFEPIEELEPAASDGVRIPCVSMEKSIDPGAHPDSPTDDSHSQNAAPV